MRVKKYVLNCIVSLRGIYMRLKWRLLVMLALLWGVLPIMNLHDILHTDESSKYFINYKILYVLPVGISFGCFSLLYSNLNDAGREVLYISKGRQFAEILTLLAVYFIAFLIPYGLLFANILDLGLICIVRYFFVCGMFAAAAYFLSYFRSNFMYGLVGTLMLYLLQFIADDIRTYSSIFSWNYYTISYIMQIFLLCAVTVCGFAGGYYYNKRYIGYDS